MERGSLVIIELKTVIICLEIASLFSYSWDKIVSFEGKLLEARMEVCQRGLKTISYE